jgi:hypothetical protein
MDFSNFDTLPNGIGKGIEQDLTINRKSDGSIKIKTDSGDGALIGAILGGIGAIIAAAAGNKN